jgi:hypothetical protein
MRNCFGTLGLLEPVETLAPVGPLGPVEPFGPVGPALAGGAPSTRATAEIRRAALRMLGAFGWIVERVRTLPHRFADPAL